MTIPPIDSYLGLYRLSEGRQQYQPTSRWGPGEFKLDELLTQKKEFVLDEFLHPKVVDVSGFEPPTCSV